MKLIWKTRVKWYGMRLSAYLGGIETSVELRVEEHIAALSAYLGGIETLRAILVFFVDFLLSAYLGGIETGMLLLNELKRRKVISVPRRN